MCDPSDEKGAEAEADHGFGHIEAALVIADEAAPASHPAEGTFQHPATGRIWKPFWSASLRTTSIVKSR